jgi:hypothetical protein
MPMMMPMNMPFAMNPQNIGNGNGNSNDKQTTGMMMPSPMGMAMIPGMPGQNPLMMNPAMYNMMQ